VKWVLGLMLAVLLGASGLYVYMLGRVDHQHDALVDHCQERAIHVRESDMEEEIDLRLRGSVGLVESKVDRANDQIGRNTEAIKEIGEDLKEFQAEQRAVNASVISKLNVIKDGRDGD
jgi:hypothetical protein